MDSICGEVLEVGNFDGAPGAIIKLSDGTKVRCETSEVLCRRVAKRLYEQLRLVGEWRRHPVGAPFYASDIDDTASSNLNASLFPVTHNPKTSNHHSLRELTD